MATLLLVTLYEYSPLFYIAVVSFCFLVTAAIVMGWFGFDVPVILRSYDEMEFLMPTPEKRMVQETNPFSLALGSGPACVNGAEEKSARKKNTGSTSALGIEGKSLEPAKDDENSVILREL
ncbi:hypothetical protein CHARACLAT_017039 [Characodon lateralis]|uniref:Uncharacterized protein n=1 Tax=Characodon lateralis TaxID=208331 RepID=A0ABU7EBN9_9TELE|nr:hypothetical protein [Characodon lateralis]